jgi:hypothetical protein
MAVDVSRICSLGRGKLVGRHLVWNRQASLPMRLIESCRAHTVKLRLASMFRRLKAGPHGCVSRSQDASDSMQMHPHATARRQRNKLAHLVAYHFSCRKWKSLIYADS